MARRQMRIAGWPFPADQEVLLTWVRSPHRTAAGGKQWRTVATFLPLTACAVPQTIELPWGMLPLLRLGTSYLDGYLQERTPRGEEHEIHVRPGIDVLFVARDCLGPAAWADLSGEDGEELLFVLEAARGHFFLPVIEAIRFLLAPNKTMALGLLEPEYLARVVADARVVVEPVSVKEHCVLHVDFTAEMTPAALGPGVIRHIGRLLRDDSFRRAWDAVERERHRHTGPGGASGELPHVPLQFPLPHLGERWRVRANPVAENAYLIAEILETTAARELPFSDVSYTYPGSTSTVRKPVAPGTGGSHAKDGSDLDRQGDSHSSRGTSLAVSALPPRDSRRPRRAGVTRYGLLGDEAIRITRRVDRERVEKVISAGATDPGGISADSSPQGSEASSTDNADGPTRRPVRAVVPDQLTAKEVSLGGAASDGERTPGEYRVVMPEPPLDPGLRPLPLECQPHDGLDAFASALRVLTTLKPPLQMSWWMGCLAGKGGYARMGSQPRRYVMVRCAGRAGPPCWLFEFAQLDRCAPSTLLVFPLGCANFEALKHFVIEELLPRALQPKGWWSRSELMKLHSERRLRFALLRHESLNPLLWADQLQRKIMAARCVVEPPTGNPD